MKVRIEMDVPDSVDTSWLLEEMQEMAVAITYREEDDDAEIEEEIDTDAITNAVSVEVLTNGHRGNGH